MSTPLRGPSRQLRWSLVVVATVAAWPVGQWVTDGLPVPDDVRSLLRIIGTALAGRLIYNLLMDRIEQEMRHEDPPAHTDRYR